MHDRRKCADHTEAWHTHEQQREQEAWRQALLAKEWRKEMRGAALISGAALLGFLAVAGAIVWAACLLGINIARGG